MMASFLFKKRINRFKLVNMYTIRFIRTIVLGLFVLFYYIPDLEKTDRDDCIKNKKKNQIDCSGYKTVPSFSKVQCQKEKI